MAVAPCPCTWRNEVGCVVMTVRNPGCLVHGDESTYWQRAQERVRQLLVERLAKATCESREGDL